MEPKRVPIRVQYSILARPQVGTTWGYWDWTCGLQNDDKRITNHQYQITANE